MNNMLHGLHSRSERFGEEKKSVAQAWNRASTHPAYSLVPIPSELPQILTIRKVMFL